MILTSLENERIKKLIKLQKKKYRDLTNTYIIEGEHLIEEAYKAGVLFEVYILEGENYSFDVDCFYVSIEIMKRISLMDTPSTIVGVCHKKKYDNITGNKILLLDEIQDPGNLGTIVRSALAFDVDMILLSNHSVDLYNEKVLRSTQGMIFHIPIMRIDSKEAITWLKKNHYPIYGTNVATGVEVSSIKDSNKKKWCLVMGNEGNGLSIEIQNMCDKNIYIPMNNQVESLNVGVACSIILYEFRR